MPPGFTVYMPPGTLSYCLHAARYSVLLSTSRQLLRLTVYMPPVTPSYCLHAARYSVLLSTSVCVCESIQVVKGHVTYFLKFWDRLHISAMVEARNFKFAMEIGH